MRGDKIAVYENALHQKIVFDNKFLFLESIDMTGTAGVHTAESLAFADGQVTISRQLAAKTIPCSFAFKNVKDDFYTKRRLEQIFNPKISGTLTVYTQKNKYQIDVYPQNVPTFQRDKVKYVYRFDVDFVADYPYWRVGDEQEIIGNSFKSANPLDIPLKIYYPADESTIYVTVNSKGFYLSARNFPVWVNTQNYTVTDENGNNCSQYISASHDIDEIFLKYGSNSIGRSNRNVRIFYQNLSLGEM